jgi:endonuclease-3
MARETNEAKTRRLALIQERLRATYPDAHCELDYSSPLELLVATILSAQCTDKQVNIVTRSLFQKYRSANDYAEAPPGALEEDVRRIGLYRNKAKNIQACCRKLVERHGGNVPDTMETLVDLDGVGRKTANVVLNVAFGAPTLAVDTHVFRVSNRIPLAKGKTPREVEDGLMKLIPQRFMSHAHHWLILHGRYICKARAPECGKCPIADLCKFPDKTAA